MSISIVAIRIEVETSNGPLRYTTSFGPGLNVLSAPNSFGKSTLLQSIAYALGLEGMFSASRKAPVGPALTTIADFPDGSRGNVLQSSVTLDISNDDGEFLRTKRFIVGGADPSLVNTWHASSYDALETAPQVDMFVRQPGSATRDRGLHAELARFLGWSVPRVPKFGGGEVPLYLEAIFPLSIVEQKSGWSGISPRLPTYLRIRDVLQRSVEFTLGLDALQRRRELLALRENESDLRRRWDTEIATLRAGTASEGFGVASVDAAAVLREQRQRSILVTELDGIRLSVSEALGVWTTRLADLEGTSQTRLASDRTPQTRQELDVAEQAMRAVAARTHNNAERTQLIVADLDSLASRLASVEADRQRALDLQRLRNLGSTLDVPVVADDRCPTCSQLLDDRHVATGHVVGLDDTLVRLDAERTTLRSMRAAAESRQAELERSQVALGRAMNEARQRVRLLKDELIGPGMAPSIAEIQERLALVERTEAAKRAEALAFVVDERLDLLAEEFQDTRERLSALEAQEQSDSDRTTVARFRQSFTGQLAEYGLRSLPPGDVTIDPDTFVPVNDGLELAFDLTLGISASDTIRTKWAYFVALAEAAMNAERGNHPGILILDEPRQQETDKVSVAALIQRLARSSANGLQVVFATSEDPNDLDRFLAGLPHTRLLSDGSRLLS